MKPDWFTEVRPSIRDGVKSILDKNPFDQTNIPMQSFHCLDRDNFMDNTTEFEVLAPGRLFDARDISDNLYQGEFEEPAQIIYNKLPEPQEDDSRTEEQRIRNIEQGLFEFTGIVLNYAGEERFNDTAFEVAFDEQFEPRFTDRKQIKYLVCLKNISLESGVSIDLETDVQGNPDYLGPYKVETLRIRTLDELEETGIATHEAPSTGVLELVESLNVSTPNPALEIVLQRQRPFREIARDLDNTEVSQWKSPEFHITPNDGVPWQKITDIINHITTRVRRCLRLECSGGVVGFEKGYHLTPGWETYRGISTPVPFNIDFDCRNASIRSVVDDDRAKEIQQIWNDYSEQLRPNNSQFQNPLSRFERMFSRETYEDQLMDCTVGCETTLLKGGSPGGNRYRLGLRAAALLGERNSQDWSAERIGDFFRTIYEYRNKVVHNDKPLPEVANDQELIKVGNREFAARNFLYRARELYADILLSYLELTSSLDLSIDEINENIDGTLLEHASVARNNLEESR